ncbi:RNA polymerase subunit sigma-70 [Streptomyces sp. NPDC004647]|uniref:RNA polymerase subunit sigma-70 n=1 Tax=Streptomyces sp. NPDC004647 TaxID=3154671 RepID=UPI0033A5A8CA
MKVPAGYGRWIVDESGGKIVSMVEAGAKQSEASAEVAAAQAGDESAFSGLAEKYRRELQVHCYRMLGSLEESEDLVQETFLRAWRKRESYQGRSTFRAWLYRIATNACLDALARYPAARRAAPAAAPGVAPPPPVAVAWLQPYPDRLLDAVAPRDDEPDAVVVARETIELAFLAAIQHLPPRQRAVLILRDVLGWSAKETAELLEASVASVNSALQRARPTLKTHLPERRLEWGSSSGPNEEERAVLQRYMDAIEHADDAAIGELLREDARVGQQPGAGGHVGSEPAWYEGRETVIEAWAPALHGPEAVDFRFLPTRANRQPAAATYIRAPGGSEYHAFGLAVLRIEDAAVAEVTVFTPGIFPAFGLPATL